MHPAPRISRSAIANRPSGLHRARLHHPRYRTFGRRADPIFDLARANVGNDATFSGQQSMAASASAMSPSNNALPVAGGMSLSSNGPTHHGLPDSKLAFFSTAILFCFIIGLGGASLAWTVWKRGILKRVRFPGWVRIPGWMRWRKGAGAKDGVNIEWKFVVTDEKGQRIDYDDKTWGTPSLTKEDRRSTQVLHSSDVARETAKRAWSQDSLSMGEFWLFYGGQQSVHSLSNLPTSSSSQVPTPIPSFRGGVIPSFSMPRPMSRSSSSRASSSVLETIFEEADDTTEEDVSQARTVIIAHHEAENRSVAPAPRMVSSASLRAFSEHFSSSEAELLYKLTHGDPFSVIPHASSSSITKGRPRQGSDASDQTAQSDVALEQFDPASSIRSTVTSMASFSTGIMTSSSADGGKSDAEEAQVFEARRVQHQSVEVKTLRLSEGTPSFIISAAPSAYSVAEFEQIDLEDEPVKLRNRETWLYTPTTAAAAATRVTTMMTTEKSSNSLHTDETGHTLTTVDLDDFPTPPASCLV